MPVSTGLAPHDDENLTGMVLPSLKVRTGSAKLPPVASAPSIGGRKPTNPKAVRVTVNVHELLLPQASVAVTVTGVAPTWNCEPDAGEATALAAPQLSTALGRAKVTGTRALRLHGITMFAGHAPRTGAVVSCTVMVWLRLV